MACFCSDVEVLLDILTPGEKLNLLEKLEESFKSISMAPIKSLGQAINLRKMQLQMRINIPVAGMFICFGLV